MTHVPPPDVIYPVRAGESNDELRFSLRSLAMNLPHARVWMVGHKPGWVTNVEYIPGGNSARHHRANLYRNLMLACAHSDVADDVLIFNDDFFVIGPQAGVPVLYRGRLADQLKSVLRKAGPRGWWQESLCSTQCALLEEGYTDPISYELHVPFPANKHAMLEVLQRFAHVAPHNPPQWRTLYGVVNQIGGVQHPDGKALKPGPIARPYHSTDDLSWRYFRSRFVQMFPEQCRYEASQPVNARPAVSVTPRSHLRSTRRLRA